ncbi:MAG: SpoIIE family protein phosphatase [Opitutales bacterium]
MAVSMFETGLSGKKVVLPAEILLMDPVRDAFEDFLADCGVAHEDSHMWMLVFTEALVNAIKHGCDHDSSKQVQVSWHIEREVIRVFITDPGDGPPATAKQQNEISEDGSPERTHGRGLFLIEHFCDECEHWRGPRGYKLVMAKHHPGIAPRESEAESGILEQALSEISLCYESLAAFYRLGDALIRSDHVGAFISSAVRDLRQVVPCQADFIGFSETLQQSVLDDLNTLHTASAPPPKSPAIQQVYENLLETIWESPDDLSEEDPLREYGFGICVPVRAETEVYGVLAWLRKPSETGFNAAEINTLRTFADLFGIAIANANNAVVRTREQQALRELEIASTIQNTLLPTQVPVGTDLENLIVHRKSAREVSGDYAEALVGSDGCLYLVTVDVMGKGVSAAFLAVMIRTALRILLERPIPLEELVPSLNNILCGLVGDMTLFATFAIAKIDSEQEKIDFVNAGHCNTILVPNKTEPLSEIAPSAPPMGLFKECNYTIESFAMDAIDRVIMVSDGIFEWETPQGVWGWEAFLEFCDSNRGLPSDQFIDHLTQVISEGSGNAPISDDQTCIIWSNLQKDITS